MADNKQYTTQLQENGVILISEDVIAAIVTQAINEVEGVAGLHLKGSSDLTEIFSKKYWSKGIKILIGVNNEVSIDCNINVTYGYKVLEVAQAAQEAIAKALDDAAGVTVVGINVNVCGIVRK